MERKSLPDRLSAWASSTWWAGREADGGVVDLPPGGRVIDDPLRRA